MVATFLCEITIPSPGSHSLRKIIIPVEMYYGGQKILAVIVCQLKKKIVIRTLLSS
jgi:hypothetical protein